jgi:hypothetical protein
MELSVFRENIYKNIPGLVSDFVQWLEMYGETSWDHQTFFANSLTRRAKALYYRKALWGTIAVGPMIFCEAFMPSARRFFGSPLRFSIADAHYAMGFVFLHQIFGGTKFYQKGLHYLNVLEKARCHGYDHCCWGYPFDWVTRNGTIRASTPLITITPYAYEAFLGIYQIDGNEKWRNIIRSTAEHAARDIKDFEVAPGVTTCSYTPFDKGGVINASAYRAFLLTSASQFFPQEDYRKIAEGNLNFVLKCQNQNGSWPYAIDSRDFVDHFHTCFVLKALAKIEKMTGHEGCGEAIERGVKYYLKNLFDERGLVKPFAKPPRLTVYKRELYDIAECLNLGVLLKGRFKELDRIVENVLRDLLARWRKPDGSFRSRELLFGWDNVPMHRWGQSQIFRSLCFLLYALKEEKTEDRIQQSE